MFIDYVNKFEEELIIVQIDLDKAHDLVLCGWTPHMGFGGASKIATYWTCFENVTGTCFFYTIVVDHS